MILGTLVSYIDYREWAVDPVNISLPGRRLIFVTKRGVEELGPSPFECDRREGVLCCGGRFHRKPGQWSGSSSGAVLLGGCAAGERSGF